MLTATMLYWATFSATHCSAFSTVLKSPSPLSSRTFRSMIWTPGAIPGSAASREPMMLATSVPWPRTSGAELVLSTKSYS